MLCCTYRAFYKDSKKLSKKAQPIIQDQAICIGLGVSDVKAIDKHNIREATLMAMKSALEKLDPDKALIDGNSQRIFLFPIKVLWR